ncbi:MAG: hypothetical protein IKU68_06220 [Oscillospiraceae bacterium]|nr:hypothetical protein [Oscillospiraceae bacterium]
MKKVLKLVLVILAICMLLACCGGTEEGEKPVSTQPNQTEKVEEPAQTEASVPEEIKAPEVTIEEAVIYDDDKVTITVKGMEAGWSGLDVKLLVENKTDRNIALSGDNVVVNGVTMSSWLYIDVAAGKKANGTLTLYSDSLETAGIDQLAWLESCDAHIYDTDSYDTLADVQFEIVTSLGKDYVQVLDEAGELLYEAAGIQVIAKVMTDEFYGKTLLLYVKNAGEKHVYVQAENISVNGFTMDAWMYDLVCAGTVRFCDLDLWESGLEENEIETIEDVTFTISIIDPNSYATLAKSGELQVFVGQ